MLVLSSLIILMAVGTAIVMLSAANITLSHKYSNWSSDYYWLDYAAQDQLSDTDKGVLVTAENVARYYLQNSYFRYSDVEEFPGGSGMPATMQATFSGASELQILINGEWQDIENLIAAVPVPDEDLQEDYNTKMQLFANKAFEVLYYTYIDSNLLNVSHDYDAQEIRASVTLQNPNWLPSVSDYSTFDSYYSAIDTMPKIKVAAKEQAAEHHKMVDVSATVIPPSFSAVQQTRYFAAKLNPLYLNALSVQGAVIFKGSGGAVNIKGDVVSNNQNESGISLGLDEENAYGIKTLSGSSVHVNIQGNVESAGDLHVFGNGSSIEVEDYPAGFSDTLKMKRDMLFATGNEYYFDLNTPGMEDAASYTEEYTSGHSNPYIPYIYKDSTGGNVYCNNLAVEKDVVNGEITVSGNVWTQDDIQNDGP